MKLTEQLQNQQIKACVIEDCTKLMDEQVAAKNGLSGVAIKTAYKVVKNVGPGYIPQALGRLLPEVATALDPLWSEGLQAGDPVAYLTQHSSRTAETLLSVTDARMERVGTGVVRASYLKLRKSAKSDVEAAIPGLAKILDAHTRVSQAS
jgi:hypothetical protein